MKSIILFSVVIFAAFLVASTKASGTAYYWNGVCSYPTVCDMDIGEYWSSGVGQNGSYTAVDLGFGVSVIASTSSMYNIYKLFAPGCYQPSKRTVQETEGASNIIDLRFYNNSVHIVSEACFGYGDESIISFTNVSLSTEPFNTDSHSRWTTSPKTTIIFDNTTANFDYGRIVSFGNTTIIFKNKSVFHKNVPVSFSLGDDSTLNPNGISLISGDTLSFEDTSVLLPCPLQTKTGVSIVFGGLTNISSIKTDCANPEFSPLFGSLVINSNSIIDASSETFVLIGDDHTISANAKFTVGEYRVTNVANSTLHNFGTVIAQTFFMESQQYNATFNMGNVINYPGATIKASEFVMAQYLIDKRSIKGDFPSENNYAFRPGYFVNQGYLEAEYASIRHGYRFNATAGSSATFNGVVFATYSFFFQGGNVTFGDVFYAGGAIKKRGDEIIEEEHYIFKGGVLTFNGNAYFDSANYTLTNEAGVFCNLECYGASWVVTDGSYLSGTGAYINSVYVLSSGELRTSNKPDEYTSANLTISTLVLSTGSKFKIATSSEAAALVKVDTVTIEEGVIFEVEFVGETLPANGTVFTFAHVTTSFTGSLPSEPVTESKTGAILTFSESNGYFRVTVTYPPTPTPSEPTPTEPTPTTPPTTPNGPSAVTEPPPSLSSIGTINIAVPWAVAGAFLIVLIVLVIIILKKRGARSTPSSPSKITNDVEKGETRAAGNQNNNVQKVSKESTNDDEESNEGGEDSGSGSGNTGGEDSGSGSDNTSGEESNEGEDS